MKKIAVCVGMLTAFNTVVFAAFWYWRADPAIVEVFNLVAAPLSITISPLTALFIYVLGREDRLATPAAALPAGPPSPSPSAAADG